MLSVIFARTKVTSVQKNLQFEQNTFFLGVRQILLWDKFIFTFYSGFVKPPEKCWTELLLLTIPQRVKTKAILV